MTQAYVIDPPRLDRIGPLRRPRHLRTRLLSPGTSILRWRSAASSQVTSRLGEWKNDGGRYVLRTSSKWGDPSYALFIRR